MRGVDDLIKIVFVVLLIVLSISCGIARFNECNRLHPFWYCMGQQ
jgi:hypothetical protein